MYNEVSSIRRLKAIDWTLPDAWTIHSVHDFHWFRAKFIPQIPAILINHFTHVGDVVLDPFCGCGTTLVESLRFGRQSIGVDIVPLACLIARVKTHLIEPGFLEEKADEFVRTLQKNFTLAFDEGLIYNESKGELNKRISESIPNFPNKEKWFHPRTLKELGLIWTNIEAEKKEDIRDFCTVCFSSILKRCSSQVEHWGYVADNMLPQELLYRNAFFYFRKKLLQMIRGMKDLYQDCKKLGLSKEDLNKLTSIYNIDARKLHPIDSSSVNLIVTSPPYPNVTDQTKMHRLSFYWLKYDMKDCQQKEIGARWKRARKNALQDYFKEMTECISEMHRVMKKYGHLCIVLGKPTGDYARSLIMEQLVSAIKSFGFVFVTKLERKVISQAIAAKKVPEEEIIIFRREE
jgi:hypothetical protein